ncbi:MAG: TIGR04552 family protein [Myxococcota bacterium]|nr:TIGR04552 family protein [Myxococcota bacterium]
MSSATSEIHNLPIQVDEADYALRRLRQALFGESIVDLTEFRFPNEAAVNNFLRLHGYDADNPLDMAALWSVHADAIQYLTEVHRYKLPGSVVAPETIQGLFLAAGESLDEEARFACLCLKSMHIYNHLRSREFVFNARVSEAELFGYLSTKVFRVLDEIRHAGVKVTEFSAGKKKRMSLSNKLMAKRDTLATHIFDKQRFRVVVESKDALVYALIELLDRLVPFNYVMPGQSENRILRPDHIAAALNLELRDVQRFWPERGSEARAKNIFSGAGFKTVNFVAEIPLRLDHVIDGVQPAIAVVQTEVQLVDEETNRRNEEGENAHARYKSRQSEKVRERLEGLHSGLPQLPRHKE